MNYQDLDFAVTKLLNDPATSEEVKSVAGHVGYLASLTRRLEERVDRMENDFNLQIRNLREQ